MKPLKPLARDALGLGLRIVHYPYIMENRPSVGYFELISENFMSKAALPHLYLEEIKNLYPLVLHGVGLNLLGSDPLDENYLIQLCRLADRVEAPFVSDHLCWSALGEHRLHDLLPFPYKRDLIAFAAERAAEVQRQLGRPFALENLSSYVAFSESEMSEWEFYTRVVKESGTYFMLDINNIYVSSQNHGFDPHCYIDAIDFDRVLQVHLAGHEMQADGSIIDTHDRSVADPVWALYRYAWERGGPFPTLLEWDEKIPPLPLLLAELARAQEVRS